MSLKDYLDGGRLEEAISAGVAAVKADPTDTDARYQYFAVLCFAGQLHKARKQLGAMDVGDAGMSRVLAVYINLLASEQERSAVFHHGAEPLLPADPPEHLSLRLKALAAASAGEAAACDGFLAEAVAAAPPLRGSLNGLEFASLTDLDELLGSALEVFAGGRYVWMPLERIVSLTAQRPAHLLDLLWLPAQLTDRQGETSNVHLPALYENSHAGDDPRAATGQVTEWYQGVGEAWRGRGQRLLGWTATDGSESDLPLLDVRSLELEPGQ